jgi:hypothetical protein
MMQSLLIGIGAGLAAALLFASLASGILAAVVLFYLAPLPVLIAAMGWNYRVGLVSVFVAASALWVAFDGYFGFAFLIGMGLPAWWIGYLALLARPGGKSGSLEWYPVGRIVLWAAALAGLAVTISVPYFGTDAQTFHANLKAAIEAALDLRSRAGAELDAQDVLNTDAMARIAPWMVAALSTIVLLINSWLAAHIVRLSGQLRRPWPELAQIVFPRVAPVLLALTLAAAIFLPDLVGIVAGIFAAALLMAFAILGFAVLHVVTRGTSGRPLVLGGVYGAVILFFWPAVIVALLGLADAALDLRGRASRSRSPPGPE